MKISEVVRESRLGTEAERLAAVSRNGHDIYRISNPSEAVQLAAMNQNGYALQHIKDPSTAVVLAAIRNDPNAIEHVKRVDPAVANDPVAKKTIIFAFLKFLKEADNDVEPWNSVRKVSERFLEVLRRAGCRWPELDLIQKSVDTLPSDEKFDDGDEQLRENDHGGFNPQKVLSHIESIVDDSVLMKINVNKPFMDGVRIDDITMFVGFLGDEGDGDLAVNYTIEEPEIGEPIPDEHELMMVFYGGAYDNELSDILIQAGFSQAASRVHGSESGMQEEGRASYDAYDIADEVRKAISGPTSQIAMTLGKNILTKNGVDINNPEPKKAEIIKWMLTRAKESAKVPFDVVVAAEALQQSGAKWPELDAILRSYKAIQ